MSIEFDEIAKFHGHKCPGLAMGYRMTKAAMKRLSEFFPGLLCLRLQ